MLSNTPYSKWFFWRTSRFVFLLVSWQVKCGQSHLLSGSKRQTWSLAWELSDTSCVIFREFYGIDESFPASQLLVRSVGGKKRNVYLVSKAVKDVMEMVDDNHKVCWVITQYMIFSYFNDLLSKFVNVAYCVRGSWFGCSSDVVLHGGQFSQAVYSFA